MNVRPETIKRLEENTSNKLLDISLDNIFSDLAPKVKVQKKKKKKFKYNEVKIFYIEKKAINNMKWQPVEGEKIFVNHISGRINTE